MPYTKSHEAKLVFHFNSEPTATLRTPEARTCLLKEEMFFKEAFIHLGTRTNRESFQDVCVHEKLLLRTANYVEGLLWQFVVMKYGY